MKSNKTIEKQYIEKKRFEYFSENKFTQNNFCLFQPYSDEEFLNSSLCGLQNPQESIKILINYYILPLFDDDEIFENNISDIENFILFCAPIELEICDKLLNLYEKKMKKLNKETNFLVIIMEILYLIVKFNEIRQPMVRRKNIFYKEFDKETVKICKNIMVNYLKVDKTVVFSDEIKFLKNAIVLQFYQNKFFDLLLEIHKIFENTNISESPNFLKIFLKPLIIQSNKNIDIYIKFLIFNKNY